MILTVTVNPCIDKTLAIPSYSPGMPNHIDNVEKIAGGKGINVARMAHHLGLQVMALCLLGGTSGIEIGNLLARDGIPYHGVLISEQNREIITVRETSTERQTAFFEPGPSLFKREEKEAFLKAFRQSLDASGLVIIAGAVPNHSFTGLYGEMIALARAKGKRVFLDSHGSALREGIGAKPFLLKPNWEEASEILGRPLRNETDVFQVADSLLNRGIEVVVISRGKGGAVLISEGAAYRAYAPEIQEINAVGSGDSLVAGLAVGLLKGYSWEGALRLGVAAGSANAATWSAGNCSLEEVNALLPLVEIEDVGKEFFGTRMQSG